MFDTLEKKTEDALSQPDQAALTSTKRDARKQLDDIAASFRSFEVKNRRYAADIQIHLATANSRKAADTRTVRLQHNAKQLAALSQTMVAEMDGHIDRALQSYDKKKNLPHSTEKREATRLLAHSILQALVLTTSVIAAGNLDHTGARLIRAAGKVVDTRAIATAEYARAGHTPAYQKAASRYADLKLGLLANIVQTELPDFMKSRWLTSRRFADFDAILSSKVIDLIPELKNDKLFGDRPKLEKNVLKQYLAGLQTLYQAPLTALADFRTKDITSINITAEQASTVFANAHAKVDAAAIPVAQMRAAQAEPPSAGLSIMQDIEALSVMAGRYRNALVLATDIDNTSTPPEERSKERIEQHALNLSKTLDAIEEAFDIPQENADLKALLKPEATKVRDAIADHEAEIDLSRATVEAARSFGARFAPSIPSTVDPDHLDSEYAAYLDSLAEAAGPLSKKQRQTLNGRKLTDAQIFAIVRNVVDEKQVADGSAVSWPGRWGEKGRQQEIVQSQQSYGAAERLYARLFKHFDALVKLGATEPETVKAAQDYGSLFREAGINHIGYGALAGSDKGKMPASSVMEHRLAKGEATMRRPDPARQSFYRDVYIDDAKKPAFREYLDPATKTYIPKKGSVVPDLTGKTITTLTTVEAEYDNKPLQFTVGSGATAETHEIDIPNDYLHVHLKPNVHVTDQTQIDAADIADAHNKTNVQGKWRNARRFPVDPKVAAAAMQAVV